MSSGSVEGAVVAAPRVKLRRVLGFWPAYGAAVGLVVSGTAMVSVGYVAGTVGWSSILTAMIALVQMMGAAFAYGELTAMLPGGGMVSEYTMPALGRLMSMFAVLSGYLVLVSCDGGTQVVIGGLSMEDITGIPQPITTCALLGILVAVKLIFVVLYGRAEAIGTIAMVGVFLVIGLLGLFRVGEAAGVAEPLEDIPTFFATGTAWLTGVGVAIWWFIGFEFACPIAEENVKPHKHIPRALWTGLLSILVLDIILVFAIIRYIPLDTLAGSAIPQIDGARAMLGGVGATFMTIVTILAALTTCNAEVAALPRMLYGMARERLVPSWFAWIHPKFRTPWVGIFFTAVIMAITIVYIMIKGADINSILTLIMTACIAWLVSYSIAMIDVIVLRKRFPDYPRLWKAPGGIVAMVIGIGGAVYAIYTLPDYWLYAAIYMAIILIYCVVWLKYKKLPLLERSPIEYLAKEIMDRSEPIVEWGPAVEEWLAGRDWDHQGFLDFEAGR